MQMQMLMVINKPMYEKQPVCTTLHVISWHEKHDLHITCSNNHTTTTSSIDKITRELDYQQHRDE
jgi:hypothetical protein